MCGIGIICGPLDSQFEDRLRIINEAQAHRGPDGAGTEVVHLSGGRAVGLAHRRLSIIDLSAGGDQPMRDESGNWIVFNGEIYNYREIRDELIDRGERLISASDTEVLLRAYRHFEFEDLLCRLRGMFAFALWDARRQTLVLARDQMGIKPLYYTTTEKVFGASSEIGALLAAGLVESVIDRQGLDSFLAYGSVQPPLTIWRGVSALLPGYYIALRPGQVPVQRRYWRWKRAGHKFDSSAIRNALEVSMDRHLVSDVPVAVLLSGGFDSTAIATLARKRSNRRIPTFTLTFPDEPRFNEGDRAERIAARIGTEHCSVPLSAKDVLASLPGFLAAQDQPSDDGLNTYLISRAVAAKGIKVCMHGVGGDELFGGYPSFRDIPRLQPLRIVPQTLRSMAALGIRAERVDRNKISEALRSNLSLLDLYLIRRRMFSYDDRQVLMGEPPSLGAWGVPEGWLSFAQENIATAGDDFAAISLLELSQYAANKLLVDGDVNAMAHSLEMRFPLLDPDLVQAALDAPASVKRMRGRNADKPALRQAVQGFPDDLMDSRKRGFTIPIASWLEGPLREHWEDVSSGALTSVLAPNTIGRIWRRFEDKSDTAAWLRVWTLFVLGHWLERTHRNTMAGNSRVIAPAGC